MKRWMWMVAMCWVACGGEPASVDMGEDPGVDMGGDVVGDAAPDLPVLGPEEAVADTCERVAEAVCAPIFTCCMAEAVDFEDEAACRAALSEACVTQSGREVAGLGRGEVVRREAEVTACVAAISEAGAQCTSYNTSAATSPCRGMFVSAANLGQACGEELGGMACAEDQGVCFPEPTGTTCKAYAAQGVACAVAPCAPGLLCMSGTRDPLDRVCDLPRGLGASCRAPVECEAELTCEAGACVARRSAGEACEKSVECAPGLFCEPMEETCRATLGDGEACYTPSTCADGLSCVGMRVAPICWPGDPDDGEDDPSLPGAFEPCEGTCRKGLSCMPGPLPGACAPSVCAAAAPMEP